MNNSPTIPPLTAIPPVGYGAAFDYNYWRWYFFSIDNEDYMWVLSENEWMAVNRIRAFRTDEVWSYADSPNQSAFTEYITWLIEMNILTDKTADIIANVSWDNPTMYPQERTMMGIYPPPQTQDNSVDGKIPENNSTWDNYGAIGEKLDDWKEVESYTGWEFTSPLETPKNSKQEVPPAPEKNDPYRKMNCWEIDSNGLSNYDMMNTPETPPPRKNPEPNIAKILNYETVSNTSSSQ